MESFPTFETEAENIIEHLSKYVGDCVDALIINDTDSTPGHLDSHYTLPNSGYWPSFKDFTIYVDIGDIDDFDPTGATCHGMDASDDWIFEKPQASLGGTLYNTVLSASMTIDLDGPSIFGSPVSGSAPMCTPTNCSANWESNAVFEVDATDFALQEFNLFASSNGTLRNGSGSYDLADVRVMLADAALGYVTSSPVAPDVYSIDPGDASFWLVGTDPYDPTTTEYVHALNSTSIDGAYNSGTGEWSLDAFEMEYVDYNSDVWTITVPASSWAP